MENSLLSGNYVEPYAGGAGVAVELLINGHVDHIHLNDSSYPIYAFWNSVLTRPDEFCKKIASASLTIEEWKRRREVIRNPEQYDEFEVGFSAFYLNRCNRSGVISGGVIGGLNQTGRWKIDARFPRNELIKRIEAIALRRGRVRLSNLDAESYITQELPKLSGKVFVYCDPPYFEKSRRLYLDRYTPEDHARIAKVIQEQLVHPWVVSYDHAPDVLVHYQDRRKFVYDLQYNASRSYKGREVFIFSDGIRIPRSSKLPYINAALADFVPRVALIK